MFITTREIARKAKTSKPPMYYAVRGVHAQLQYGSTPQNAIDYVRINLNLTKGQVEELVSKFAR
jgi:hypothetical protein